MVGLELVSYLLSGFSSIFCKACQAITLSISQITVFSKYTAILISPLGSAIFLALVAFLLIALHRRKFALMISALAVFWLFIFSTPMVSYQLRLHMESVFSPVPIADVPKSDAIVALGGGISPAQPHFPFINLTSAADRTYQAARLYKAGKAHLVVLSGGSDPQVSEPEANAMATFIQDLGVPASALLLEGLSRTTRENAIFTAKHLKERGIDRIILVTSALHMQRAKRLFEEQGLMVFPDATDYEATTKPYGPLAYLPDTDALDGSSRAIKEWVGLWVVKLGRLGSPK